jgi:hypothetical protein
MGKCTVVFPISLMSSTHLSCEERSFALCETG